MPSEIHHFGVRLFRRSIKVIHAAELDARIKRGGGQPSCFEAWLADEDRCWAARQARA